MYEVECEFVRPTHSVVLNGSNLVNQFRGDCSDPAFGYDVVRPSNGSQKAAPPKELAADHRVRIVGMTAAPSNRSPCHRTTLLEPKFQVCSVLDISFKTARVRLEPCTKSPKTVMASC
jgi:hypothetical protein